jgi:hypothetical protein
MLPFVACLFSYNRLHKKLIPLPLLPLCRGFLGQYNLLMASPAYRWKKKSFGDLAIMRSKAAK